MCKKRNGCKPSFPIGDKEFRLDECMIFIVYKLNKLGLETLGCCCGHGKYPMTIVARDKNGIFEVFSNTVIPRKRRFYKKDGHGFYFIPEVQGFWRNYNE